MVLTTRTLVDKKYVQNYKKSTK